MMHQIKDININSYRVNILVKVFTCYKPIYTQGFKSLTFIASDNTGKIQVTFWNNLIDLVRVGDYIEIRNGYVRVSNGKIAINIRNIGCFKHIKKPVNL